MSSKTPSKNIQGPSSKSGKAVAMSDVALAAVISAKKQKEVGEFLDFFVGAMERNSGWINSVVEKQADFRCALMVGAGPNRYQLQEVIFPAADEGRVKLEVELRDSDDFDKIAIVALFKISNHNMNQALEFVKYRLHQNPKLRGDLLKGKSMGVTYAVLKPYSEKLYRVVERIAIDSSKALPVKKTREKSPILKKFLRI